MPRSIDFPVADLLDQLRDEFTYHAQAKGLALRVVPCSLSISSDPRLLEQMIRNLLSNALKYTKRGKVLLGCRRHRGVLSIEVWDTGIGIPEEAACRRSSRSIISSTTPRGNEAAASALAFPSCIAWARCWVIRSTCGRARERVRSSRSMSR